MNHVEKVMFSFLFIATAGTFLFGLLTDNWKTAVIGTFGFVAISTVFFYEELI